jgi:hypothetical protein
MTTGMSLTRALIDDTTVNMIYRIEAFVEFSDTVVADRAMHEDRLDEIARGVRSVIGSNGFYHGDITIAPITGTPPSYKQSAA